MTKKIYISIPITGHDIDQQKRTAEALKAMLQARGADNDIHIQAITPFEVCPDPTQPYPQLMGRDIQALLESDAALFCKGWQNSRGCQAEHAVAKIYNKEIYYQ